MAALRILHVVESFGAGTMQIVRSIAERSVADGHATAIAFGVQPETPADAGAGLDPRVELHPTPWTARGPRAQLRAAAALRRIADGFAPDVVHLHSSFAGAVGSAALAGRHPCVYTPHAYAFQRGDLPRAARLALRGVESGVARRVALVGAVGRHEAEQARRGAHAARVAVVVNGIPELDEPVAPAGERAEPRVVAAGRAGPQRQPEAAARILRAVEDLASVEWIGGGSRTDAGARALAQAGIPLTGWLPRAAVADRLGAATAYLHWSAWDGLSLALLEAMAHDVIAVASAIGPNEEVLGPDQVFGDEAAAIAFLRALLADPELREHTRARQRERATAFGARRMTADWLATYRRVVAGAV